LADYEKSLAAAGEDDAEDPEAMLSSILQVRRRRPVPPERAVHGV
jgi:hypothetical protein